MIYKLIEWDGKGSGHTTLITEDKKKAMMERECTLTKKEILKKNPRFFYASDVKCSEIISYSSNKALIEGRPKTNSNWY